MNITIASPDFLFANIMEFVVPNITKYKDRFSFLFNYKNEHDFINDFFVRSFFNKNKFSVYSEFIKNPFLNENKKKELINFFCLGQRVKNVLTNYYFKKNYKKLNNYSGNIDLFHAPLENFNKKFIIKLIQDDTIYKFQITDILKLINTGLLYAPDLFPEPKMPCNPWTNLPFTKTNLYNIYFHIIDNNLLLPQLFYSFFRCDWDIKKLLYLHEPTLRDKAINNYYDDASINKKYGDIIIMLRKYRYLIPNIVIHPRFSKVEVVEKLQGLLLDHLRCEYTYNPSLRIKSKNTLKYKLRQFQKNDPKFGRVIFRTRRSMHRDLSNGFNFNSTESENNNESQRPNIRYTSFNLLSDSIPNYTHIDDIIDHISDPDNNIEYYVAQNVNTIINNTISNNDEDSDIVISNNEFIVSGQAIIYHNTESQDELEDESEEELEDESEEELEDESEEELEDLSNGELLEENENSSLDDVY